MSDIVGTEDAEDSNCHCVVVLLLLSFVESFCKDRPGIAATACLLLLHLALLLLLPVACRLVYKRCARQSAPDANQRGCANVGNQGRLGAVEEERQRQVQAEDEERLEATEERRRREERPAEYDFVLKFGSLSEFLASGRIDMATSAASTFNLSSVAEHCRVVAVVGPVDKGKTFLINELLGLNLPSGKLCTTSGLSFYCAQERRMLLVDSAGVQAPVSHHQGERGAARPVVDAQATECMTLEVISRIAHQVLVVVNDLTCSDQKFIFELCKKVSRHGASDRDLIIVHNMRTTAQEEEAMALFSRQTEQVCGGVAPQGGELCYASKAADGAPVVQHIGICQKGSPAGERFNAKNLGRIMSMLEYRNTVGSSIKIGELLAREFQRVLRNLGSMLRYSDIGGSDVKVKLGELLAQEFGRALPSVVATEAPNGADAIAAPLPVEFEGGPRPGLVLRTPEGARAVLRTMGMVSALGEMISHDVSFEAPWSMFDQIRDGEVFRNILVECPGVAAENIEVTQAATGVKVELHKRKLVDEGALGTIAHGRWVREFSFDDGHFEMSEADLRLESGVLKITLRKQLLERRWKLTGRTAPAPRDAGGSRAARLRKGP